MIEFQPVVAMNGHQLHGVRRPGFAAGIQSLPANESRSGGPDTHPPPHARLNASKKMQRAWRRSSDDIRIEQPSRARSFPANQPTDAVAATHGRLEHASYTATTRASSSDEHARRGTSANAGPHQLRITALDSTVAVSSVNQQPGARRTDSQCGSITPSDSNLAEEQRGSRTIDCSRKRHRSRPTAIDLRARDRVMMGAHGTADAQHGNEEWAQ